MLLRSAVRSARWRWCLRVRAPDCSATVRGVQRAIGGSWRACWPRRGRWWRFRRGARVASCVLGNVARACRALCRAEAGCATLPRAVRPSFHRGRGELLCGLARREALGSSAPDGPFPGTSDPSEQRCARRLDVRRLRVDGDIPSTWQEITDFGNAAGRCVPARLAKRLVAEIKAFRNASKRRGRPPKDSEIGDFLPCGTSACMWLTMLDGSVFAIASTSSFPAPSRWLNCEVSRTRSTHRVIRDAFSRSAKRFCAKGGRRGRLAPLPLFSRLPLDWSSLPPSMCRFCESMECICIFLEARIVFTLAAFPAWRIHGQEGRRNDAGWSSLVARRAHNPEVVGSNPAPATKSYSRSASNSKLAGLLCFWKKNRSWGHLGAIRM